MIAFPGLLISPAEKAGITIPPDPDSFDREEFLHFALFCDSQLERPMTMGSHWENAKVIAKVPLEKIKTITMDELKTMGFVI